MTNLSILAQQQKTTKISTCLPTPVWEKLVIALRSPYSRAEPGRLDRGAMAEWILEQALDTIANKGLNTSMHTFLNEKGLTTEFEEFFKNNSTGSLL